jgi:hypothetical protein
MKPFDKIVLTILALLTSQHPGDGLGERADGRSCHRDNPGRRGTAGFYPADVRIIFERPMNVTAVPDLTLSPTITGTTRWEGANTLVFSPAAPLAANSRYDVTLARRFAQSRRPYPYRPP